MNLNLWYPLLTGSALVISILVFARRLRAFNALTRPIDRATPKGNTAAGVLYAFTQGMLPWAKESTRLHLWSHLRGVAFHLAIFLGLAILLISPWLDQTPIGLRTLLAVFIALGAVFGMLGFVARLVERNLKALSTRDDYFAVLIVSLFLATESVALIDFNALPIFYVTSTIMLLYAPLGKIRHCIYFAYSRLFFGKAIGSKAVLPHRQQVEVRR